jgi:hypothetical protein
MLLEDVLRKSQKVQQNFIQKNPDLEFCLRVQLPSKIKRKRIENSRMAI